MKKKLFCLCLLLVSALCFVFGALAVSAEGNGEMILLSSYGSGYCINTQEMAVAGGDGVQVRIGW